MKLAPDFLYKRSSSSHGNQMLTALVRFVTRIYLANSACLVLFSSLPVPKQVNSSQWSITKMNVKSLTLLFYLQMKSNISISLIWCSNLQFQTEKRILAKMNVCQLIYYLIEKCQRIDERGSLHQSEEKWHNWAPPITEAPHCIWRAFCQIAHEYQLAVLEIL